LNIQLLYFFAHRPYPHRSTASAVLKGWLYQLIQQRPDLTKSLCEQLVEHTEYLHAYLDNARLLWSMLRRALKAGNAGTTYCVLDGLHECDEESQSVIIELLTRPPPFEGCPEKAPALKILITTRTRLTEPSFGEINVEDIVRIEPPPSTLQDPITGESAPEEPSAGKSTSEEPAPEEPAAEGPATDGTVKAKTTPTATPLDRRLSDLTTDDNPDCSEALEMLAAFLYPPTTRHFMSFFVEKR
jgi:hypothetical protein